MTERLSEALNKTQGTEIIVPCSKCSGRTAHDVVSSFDQFGEDDSSYYQWGQHYQIIRCKGCKTVSFRDAYSNSEDYIQISDDEWENEVFEKLYPSRLEGRKDLGKEARYLPNDVNRIYQETVQALSNNSPVLAGIGLRALVEAVCKEKNATGSNLFEKIDDLANKQVVTPAGTSILHKVRTLGNAAAHEVKPHSETQLALAMSVIEHMLKDVYVIPKLVDAEFD
ncbi:DUF4145 domain-containing protein [Chromobacterium vaccinii]|uniref:DUF4145 domain-containing protein n=1 Tax=Chromobacterium vaccinii TaxID=1108595 RepID=UPI0031D654AB